MILNKVY